MDDSRRENDAEHTWHMAVCAMLFLEYTNGKKLDMLNPSMHIWWIHLCLYTIIIKLRGYSGRGWMLPVIKYLPKTDIFYMGLEKYGNLFRVPLKMQWRKDTWNHEIKGVTVMKKEFPILEFDNTRNAIIEPKKIIQRNRTCCNMFFQWCYRKTKEWWQVTIL